MTTSSLREQPASRAPTPGLEASQKGASKALSKGLAIIDSLAQNPRGLALHELVTLLALPKGTVLRLLGVLTEARVVRFADSAYRVGPQCALWANAFSNSLDLRILGADLPTQLVSASDETAHLAVPDGERILYLDKVESPHSLRMVSQIGTTSAIHATGLGKAILVYLPEAAVERILRSH